MAISSHVGDGWLTRLELMYPEAARRYPHRVVREPVEGGPHDLSPTQRLLSELHAASCTPP